MMTEPGQKSAFKLLVAEDDRELNQLMQRTLQREGFITAGVTRGSDVIEWIQEKQNTLLLLDYSLPDMSGKQLIETLSQGNCTIPFIVITGQGNEKIAVNMMKMGAKDYLIKDARLIEMLPVVVKKVIDEVEMEQLMQKVEDALQKKSYLNQIILDRMPCVTLLLQPYTREIIASNAAAVKRGAIPGRRCFSTWIRNEEPCPWCRAPVLWERGEEQHIKFEDSGKVWDAYWVPVDETMYLHYAFEITNHIHH